MCVQVNKDGTTMWALTGGDGGLTSGASGVTAAGPGGIVSVGPIYGTSTFDKLTITAAAGGASNLLWKVRGAQLHSHVLSIHSKTYQQHNFPFTANLSR